MSLRKTSVSSVYNHVIEDVIFNVREIFAEEGVDGQVLDDLKELWHAKLFSSKAFDNPQFGSTELNLQTKISDFAAATSNVDVYTEQNINPAIKNQSHVQIAVEEAIQQNNNQIKIVPVLPDQDKLIPIQVTLSFKPTTEATQKVFSIKIPASACNREKLSTLFSESVLSAIKELPHHIASEILQQHVNSILQNQQQQPTTSAFVVSHIDGSFNVSEPEGNLKKKNVKAEFISPGTDGENYFSDDDSSNDSEEIDVTTVDNISDNALEEDSLNSDDDVADEDSDDMFSTDNNVVCLYDKIKRSRNKWRIFLKDGIMTLNGKDFLFQKAYGDTEW